MSFLEFVFCWWQGYANKYDWALMNAIVLPIELKQERREPCMSVAHSSSNLPQNKLLY